MKEPPKEQAILLENCNQCIRIARISWVVGCRPTRDVAMGSRTRYYALWRALRK